MDGWTAETGGEGGEGVEDFAGDEPFAASHDLFAGLAFRCSAGHVGSGSLVVTSADQDDGEQGLVGSPVAAPVEPMPADSLNGV